MPLILLASTLFNQHMQIEPGIQHPDDLFKMFAAESSPQALRRVYDYYHETIEKCIRYYLGSDASNQEVLSDVFQTLWEQRQKLSTLDKPLGWLLRVARNLALDRLHRNEVVAFSPLGTAGEATETSTPLSLLEYRDLLEVIREASCHLTPKEKDIFQLIKLEGWSPAEVAQQQQLSVQTVKNHLHRALDKIKATLPKYLRSLFI